MARLASTRMMGVHRRLRRTPPARWLWGAVVASAALAITLIALAHVLAPSPDQAQTLIGRPAPTFTLPAAQHEQRLAQPITFDGHSGHPTLLVFFNTLCVHCVPGVQAAGDAARSAGLSSSDILYLDAPGENAEITGRYMTRLQEQPPVLLDAGAHVASRYGVAYYPTLILVDARGVVRAVWVGAPSAAQLRAAIARSG